MTDSNYNSRKLSSGALTPDMIADMTEHVLRAVGFDFNDELNDRLDASKASESALRGIILAFQSVENMKADGLAGKGTLVHIRRIQGVNVDDEGKVEASKTAVSEMGQTIEWPLFLPNNEALKGTDAFGIEYPVKSKDVTRVFGKPGKDGTPWYEKNIIVCRDSKGQQPTLPGVSTNRWVKVHRQVEPFFREAMRRAKEACPEYFELFGGVVRFGAFNYRHMRHDPSKPLSRHSWGICCDIEAKWNSGKSFRKGECPAPWSDEWWKVYPQGMPKPIVDAFYSCGFAWGGDWDGDGEGADQKYSDPMHFQWYGNRSYAKATAAER